MGAVVHPVVPGLLHTGHEGNEAHKFLPATVRDQYDLPVGSDVSANYASGLRFFLLLFFRTDSFESHFKSPP